MKTKNEVIEDSDDLDEIYDKYKDVDFSNAKRASEVPHIAKLQAEHAQQQIKAGKQRITMWLDVETVDAFRQRCEATGKGYQTLINEVLGDYVKGWSLVDAVRHAVKEAIAEK